MENKTKITDETAITSNDVLADSFAFGLYCMDYEHGSTHMNGTKKYRIKGGGVYSKCSTIEELYKEFKNPKANVG